MVSLFPKKWNLRFHQCIVTWTAWISTIIIISTFDPWLCTNDCDGLISNSSSFKCHTVFFLLLCVCSNVHTLTKCLNAADCECKCLGNRTNWNCHFMENFFNFYGLWNLIVSAFNPPPSQIGLKKCKVCSAVHILLIRMCCGKK